MSYLKSLRRLLPMRKAWRVFTTTLQSKLHKLNRSKAIKKHKKNHHLHNHVVTTPSPSRKPKRWPSLPFKSSSQQTRRSSGHHVNTLRYKPRRHRVQKKTAPVYIDQLFLQPAVALNQPFDTAAEGSVKGKVRDRDQAAPAPAPAAAGTSRGDEKSRAADDMWESLVLASPQMHGINERAEEFITRFRAGMRDGQL